MKRPLRLFATLVLLGSLAFAAPARAQDAAFAARVAELVPSPFGILSNSVTNLHVQGDTLWAGPLLSLTADGGDTWYYADVDSLQNSPNRVFSLDVEGDVVWVGLGYVDASSGDGVQSAGGFLVSRDGGATFDYRFAQLDANTDTVVVYGGNTLAALPVIVPQQSPPFDIDYDPVRDQVWVAGWASGIRRSDDGGRTWDRVVLPPDELDVVDPDSTYDFSVEPQRGGRGELNYLGFSVLVDEAGTVWAGTPAGVNRSDDGVRWERFDAADGLTGSWVVSIEEQPLPGRNPVWLATWNAGEAGEQGQFGATVTRDGGATFEPVLLGERIYDFAFRGTTVYAAGENGLFVTDDAGRTWRQIRSFRDPANPEDVPVRPDAEVFSVAVTPTAVWAGTSDGLVRSTDGGTSWRAYRVDVPVNPDAPTAAVPDVDVYAYPNPFSPFADRDVRIRYELDRADDVEVRVFDFGMNLVRTVFDDAQPAGPAEVRWDGRDDDGLRVANGVYLYTVEGGGATRTGKILVIE